MGTVSVTVLKPDRYDGRQYLGAERLTPWPADRTAPPGQLITYFPAIPPGHVLPRRPPGLYWWADAQFLPGDDARLVVSVTAFEHRGAGVAPVIVSSRCAGLLYTIAFRRKISWSLVCASRSSSAPHVHPHPDGRSVLFPGAANMTLLNLHNKQAVVRQKDFPSCNFRFTAQAPDGRTMAYINRTSRRLFELRVVRLDLGVFSELCRADLHDLHKGFQGCGNFTDEVECKFSPDSSVIAVTSSFGMALVVTWERFRLTLCSDPVPCLLARNGLPGARLATERCADFDPRAKHRLLALGCEGPLVYLCDTEADTVAGTLRVHSDVSRDDDVTIDVLRYTPHGRHLAVATSDAHIRLYDPDLCALVFCIDGSNCGAGISLTQDAQTRSFPRFVRLSFTQCGRVMSVTTTDGWVRLWQLQPDLSLQHLARMCVLRHTAPRDLLSLPLPEKLILYLLQWPTE